MCYADVAVKVMLPFVEGAVEEADLRAIVEETYGVFDGDDPAPLVKLRDNEYVLELFHGPTLAFTD